jgi:ribose/xylose/arabinose/galactoside ABC-type transport system permease subunit
MNTDSKSARGAGSAVWAAVLKSPEFSLVIGIAACLGLIHILDPSDAFFSAYNRMTLAHQVALYGVLALGSAVVIISGGIDLSVGAVVALSSIVAAKLMTSWLPGAQSSGNLPIGIVVVTVSACLFLGLVVGVYHALLINSLRLPPFIATLASLAGLRSLAAILSNNRPVSAPFRAFRALGSDPWFTIPIFAVLAVAVSIMMGWTVLGRHLFALGGNEAAARLSGLATRRLKMVAYGLSGMLSALGGILFAGRSGQGQSTLGASYELYAITAAVVGGCSLAGGAGSIRGTVLGLILIQIVIKGTGLVVKGIDSTQIEGLVLGTVVVLAVAFNQRVRGRA